MCSFGVYPPPIALHGPPRPPGDPGDITAPAASRMGCSFVGLCRGRLPYSSLLLQGGQSTLTGPNPACVCPPFKHAAAQFLFSLETRGLLSPP